MLPAKGKTNDSFPPARPLPAPGSGPFHLCIAGRKPSEMSDGSWGGAHLSCRFPEDTAGRRQMRGSLGGCCRRPDKGGSPNESSTCPCLRKGQRKPARCPIASGPCVRASVFPPSRFPARAGSSRPAAPALPPGRGGAAGVMLHTCRKPLIKLEISDRGCRSSCVINHRAAG